MPWSLERSRHSFVFLIFHLWIQELKAPGNIFLFLFCTNKEKERIAIAKQAIMPSTPQFLSAFKQTAQSLTAGRRPWSVFLDISSFNLPSSVADATTRVSQNLSHFAVNYAVIFLLVLLLSLLRHPLSILAFLLLLAAWVFLYFSREEPLGVFGFEVGDLGVLVALVAATVVVLVWSGVWLNIFVGSAIGVVLVGMHAVLRGTDDLVADDFDPAPYGNLLSDEESPRLGL